MGLIPGSGRSPGGGKWQPTSIFLSEKFHGQRSLAGYSPKGHKELGNMNLTYSSLDFSHAPHFLMTVTCLGRFAGGGKW